MKGGGHGHINHMSYIGIRINMRYFAEFTTPESILGFISAGSLAAINIMAKADVIDRMTAVVAALIAVCIAIVAFLIQLKKLRQESIRLMIEEMNFKKLQEQQKEEEDEDL